MKTRREFFKECFRIGGYAGIAGLGLGAIEEAMGWGILPAPINSRSLGGGVSWPAWNETNEHDLSSDKSSELAFIVMAEGGAGQNEIGLGGNKGLTDRTITDALGTIAGVSGGSRAITAGKYFSATTGLINGILGNTSKWAIIQKVEDVGYAVASNDQLFYLYGNVGGVDGVNMYRWTGATQKLYCVYAINGANIIGVQTVNDLPNTGVYYLFAIHTGTNCYMGFSAVRPITAAHCTTANQYKTAADTSQMDCTFNTTRYLIGDAANDTDLKWHYTALFNYNPIPGLT